MNQFARTELLIHSSGTKKLQQATVAVFGLGGVGSYVVEALVRSGIGHLILIDDDVVSVTNLNRQLIATWDTIGQPKVDVCANRALSINPNIKLTKKRLFVSKETIHELNLEDCDFMVDAVDTVTAKLLIIETAHRAGIPVISCMGTGNKLDPTKLSLTTIEKTEICPLAKVMRKELRKRNIQNVPVVYSTETIIRPNIDQVQKLKQLEPGIQRDASNKYQKVTPGSTPFVPATAGLIIASKVVETIINKKSNSV